jgi:hypothetical protein
VSDIPTLGRAYALAQRHRGQVERPASARDIDGWVINQTVIIGQPAGPSPPRFELISGVPARAAVVKGLGVRFARATGSTFTGDGYNHLEINCYVNNELFPPYVRINFAISADSLAILAPVTIPLPGGANFIMEARVYANTGGGATDTLFVSLRAAGWSWTPIESTDRLDGLLF